MRLDKFLSHMGTDSRSEIKKQVRKGNVCVDGNIVKDPGVNVGEDAIVTYCGKSISYEKYQYYILNKPAGLLTATTDKRQPTVMDLFEGERCRDLFPVGRLDKDTVGLLLITNDGALAHELLSPKKHVDKVYYAKIDGPVGENEIKAFSEGVKLSDFTALPAKLEIDSSTPNESCVPVTVFEGKFHQVKRMFEALGRKVIYLKRESMGVLKLPYDLKEGEYKALSDDEIKMLKDRN